MIYGTGSDIRMIHANGLSDLMSLNWKANHQTSTCREMLSRVPVLLFYDSDCSVCRCSISSNKPWTREQHKGCTPGVYSAIMKNNSLKKQALCEESHFNIIGTPEKRLFPAIFPSVQTDTVFEKRWDDDLLQIKKKKKKTLKHEINRKTSQKKIKY